MLACSAYNHLVLAYKYEIGTDMAPLTRTNNSLEYRMHNSFAQLGSRILVLKQNFGIEAVYLPILRRAFSLIEIEFFNRN